MTKILKLFSLLFMLMFSMCFAFFDEGPSNTSSNPLDKYRLYVTKVDPEFHCFELSNGMVCHTIKKEWRSEKLPEVGVEVRCIPWLRPSTTRKAKIEEGELIVFYGRGRDQAPLSVWINPDSLENCLSFVSTQVVCTQPAGWFFSAVNENVIELSDGSKWILGEKSGDEFEHGDCMMITPGYGWHEWRIIDLSKDLYEWWKHGYVVMHYSDEIKPYLVGEITKE